MPGHRVAVEIELRSSDSGGLRSPVHSGNRSLLYYFEGLGPDDEDRVAFGAIVDNILRGGSPGETILGELWFWVELAAVYATRGAKFDVWYAGRMVGHGTVLKTLPDELLRDDGPSR